MVHVAKEMERQGFDVPLLIGGATTSKAHTAVKIQPHYNHGVIHVVDASRSVNVVSSLLNPERKGGYLAEIDAEYQGLRTQYADRSTAREILPFEEARANAFSCDWQAVDLPVPAPLGVTDFDNFPLDELVAYIDWSPFFHAWELRGRFPAIFEDPVVGLEARKFYDDARRLLDDIVRHQRFRARGVLGFWPANRVGEDIQLYADAEATVPVGRFSCFAAADEEAARTAKFRAGGLCGPARVGAN